MDIFGKGNLLSSSTVTTQSWSHSVKVTVRPWPSLACACSCHAGSPCNSTIKTLCTDVCAGLKCASSCHAESPCKSTIKTLCADVCQGLKCVCSCHAGLPYDAQQRQHVLTAARAGATLSHEHLQYAVRVSMVGTEQTNYIFDMLCMLHCFAVQGTLPMLHVWLAPQNINSRFSTKLQGRFVTSQLHYAIYCNRQQMCALVTAAGERTCHRRLCSDEDSAFLFNNATFSSS